VSTPDREQSFAGPFMDDYFAECEDHLAAVRHGLLALESAVGSSDPPGAILEQLFRSFHSLKGLSAMVELREAERLSHEMESCLRAIRQHEVQLSSVVLDALIDGVQVLELVIAARRGQSAMPGIAESLASLADAAQPGRLSDASAGGRPAAPGPATSRGQLWNVTFTPSPALVARGIKVDIIRGRLGAVGQIQSVTPRVANGGVSFDFQVLADDGEVFAAWRDDGVESVLMPQPAAEEPVDSLPEVAPAVPREMGVGAAPANFVRVDLARLDDLMRLVGELVVSRARLEDTLLKIEPFTPAAEWRALQEHNASIERHLRDLREGVMRVRLVPVGEIFRRMAFVVRDLARDHGKRIHLDLNGQSTEIDKFVIERMMDPVLHLVRNAVSHGIEPPDERTAAGKRPDGTIRLSASTLGESAVLEVSDDGRGMDSAAILQRARASGLDVADGPADARVLLDVICSTGFSTRDAVDRASGRGVGMAVVRDSIQELGGSLSLDTTLGQGTTFRIVLPLTLAITDALIVHVGERVFAVPQSAVTEVGAVDVEAIRVIENNELITHRGAALPVVRLARLFSLGESVRGRKHLIVVGAGPAAVGLLVDRISGQREIVVKNLRDPLVKVAGVSGATELGDGRLVLILEPAALIRKVRFRASMRAAAARE
jgi:two-component system chemotaxis sensor kinase CheA